VDTRACDGAQYSAAVSGAITVEYRWMEQHYNFKLNGLEIELSSSKSVENSNAVFFRFPTASATYSLKRLKIRSKHLPPNPMLPPRASQEIFQWSRASVFR
jgi:hypothetical protein